MFHVEHLKPYYKQSLKVVMGLACFTQIVSLEPFYMKILNIPLGIFRIKTLYYLTNQFCSIAFKSKDELISICEILYIQPPIKEELIY